MGTITKTDEELNAEFDELAAQNAAVGCDKPIKWEMPAPPDVKKTKAAITRTRQIAFLKAFAECGRIGTACKAVGINYTTQKAWHSDPWYVQHFKDAYQAYQEVIEQEIHNRAIVGEQVPIVGKRWNPAAGALEDEIIGHKTVKSDLLLMFHGKRHIPQYRDGYEPPKDDKVVPTESPIARILVRLEMIGERQRVHIPTDSEMRVIDVTPEQPQLTEGTIVDANEGQSSDN